MHTGPKITDSMNNEYYDVTDTRLSDICETCVFRQKHCTLYL